MIFDVREAGEYAVSHIDGAVRVDPAITAEALLAQYGADMQDKTLVLYCSVGVRSSRLAQRLSNAAQFPQATPIYNLEKGIFGWHNEGRPLVMANGAVSSATDYVHPYNLFWGRMVNRKDLKRSKAE